MDNGQNTSLCKYFHSQRLIYEAKISNYQLSNISPENNLNLQRAITPTTTLFSSFYKYFHSQRLSEKQSLSHRKHKNKKYELKVQTQLFLHGIELFVLFLQHDLDFYQLVPSLVESCVHLCNRTTQCFPLLISLKQKYAKLKTTLRPQTQLKDTSFNRIRNEIV